MDGKKLILLGLVGVLVGVALPLLMVIQVLAPSFLLSLVAFLASVVGLLLGLIGSARYARSKE